jgi:hypothetical protein
MWSYPMWTLWADAQPTPHQPSAVELVLVRVRHPSFTAAVAETLVRDLSRRDAHRLWTKTGRLLEANLEDDMHLRLVVLRERLLDRLEPAPDVPSGRGARRRRNNRC